MGTLALAAAAVVGALVAWLSGYFIVPLMHKLKFGQTINEIGPTWHKEKKQGIATMGGFIFIIGSFFGLLAAYPILVYSGVFTLQGEAAVLGIGVFTAFAFGAIGFIDDWLKVARRQNLGLMAWQKLILQTAVAVCFLVTLHLLGRLSTQVRLPFFGVVEFGLLFYPISLVVIVGIVNAVNLTDGIDGLAASVSLVVFIAYLLLLIVFAKLQLALWAAALAGGCVGFLFWNFYPAKIFMGDTGSLFLGGAVVALGYCMGRPDVLIILSLVYIAEAVSVMIQVSYFKITKKRTGTGKRVFKMTPIHHHFELSGWGEVKIDVVFSLIAVICGAVAYLYAYVLG